MNPTAFPATPGEVAVLTPQEFAVDLDELDGNRVPSLERVCRTFTADANRALVWWIRFKALKVWCTRSEVTSRLDLGPLTLRRACSVAASFPLNPQWEFEPEDFYSAIEALDHGRDGTISPP